MSKRLKILTLVVIAGLAAGGAAGVVELKRTDALILQGCADTGRPVVSAVCDWGLYRFHPTAEEVASMNRTAGAMFPLQRESETEARRLLKHYLGAGLDINAVDERIPVKWTALHAMASEPNATAVRILLESGAKADLRDAKGRTPADVARERAQRNPQEGHDKVLQLLEAAQRPAAQ
ncbi:hypothetical protein OOT46_08990 [Aquabacterium sp. A7-Y]|uniref:ankyrin repeat domain-containing protein n=1 Tax=Aquabacterium sp. A7-Y TaxID=1349605 RepID=UPI00223CDFFA|nr:ankyrin repeat domain-containing protein [Aquabacterium sp. A7-Y]MCW7537983.1 hypothetical protein [Aquabacterium sp. A7-Y]